LGSVLEGSGRFSRTSGTDLSVEEEMWKLLGAAASTAAGMVWLWRIRRQAVAKRGDMRRGWSQLKLLPIEKTFTFMSALEPIRSQLKLLPIEKTFTFVSALEPISADMNVKVFSIGRSLSWAITFFLIWAITSLNPNTPVPKSAPSHSSTVTGRPLIFG